MIQNNGGWELHLYKLLPSGGRDLGVVSTFISNNYSDYDLVAIGDCLLILTKGRRPYWYREGDGLIPLPNENMPSRDG